jgi:glycosyltransferase involved in cell wall biosynthesis
MVRLGALVNSVPDVRRATNGPDRPRVLFVGHARMPDATAMQKWDALSEILDIRVILEGDDPSAPRDSRIIPIPQSRHAFLRGAAFYARLPRAIRRELERFHPTAVVAQSPYDGIAAWLARRLTRTTGIPLIVEVHGDWRSATRFYGSRWRRVLSPVGDAAAVWALRRADAIRAIGPTMGRLVEEAARRRPLAVFPTFFDADAFFAPPVTPLPANPAVLWVGTLESTKNPRLLAAAWRRVERVIPHAQLVVVGSGPLQGVIDALQQEYPLGVRRYAHLEPAELRHKFDSATMLVLSSQSEGLGRVIIEAFARGRPVVATRVGGIPDLVKDEVNGLLVEPDSAEGLAQAMIRVLNNPALAAELGAQARTDAEAHHWTTDRYANAVFRLVRDALAHACDTSSSR